MKRFLVALVALLFAATALLERDEQLRTLRSHLTHARSGKGAMVFVGGEAGIGKSALVRRFCNDAARTARVLVGGCDAMQTPRPLGPHQDMAPGLRPPFSTLLDDDSARRHLPPRRTRTTPPPPQGGTELPWFSSRLFSHARRNSSHDSSTASRTPRSPNATSPTDSRSPPHPTTSGRVPTPDTRDPAHPAPPDWHRGATRLAQRSETSPS